MDANVGQLQWIVISAQCSVDWQVRFIVTLFICIFTIVSLFVYSHKTAALSNKWQKKIIDGKSNYNKQLQKKSNVCHIISFMKESSNMDYHDLSKSIKRRTLRYRPACDWWWSRQFNSCENLSWWSPRNFIRYDTIVCI